MRSTRALWLGAWFVVCAGACSSPTQPEPVPAGYNGEWAGTTGQGTPVSFTVSGEQVMSLNLSFNLSSTCSGSVTLPGPKAIIMQDPPGRPPFDQPGFAMGLTGGNFEWGIALFGAFSRDRRTVLGEFKLVQYPGCDTVVGGTWSARRR